MYHIVYSYLVSQQVVSQERFIGLVIGFQYHMSACRSKKKGATKRIAGLADIEDLDQVSPKEL